MINDNVFISCGMPPFLNGHEYEYSSTVCELTMSRGYAGAYYELDAV